MGPQGQGRQFNGMRSLGEACLYNSRPQPHRSRDRLRHRGGSIPIAVPTHIPGFSTSWQMRCRDWKRPKQLQSLTGLPVRWYADSITDLDLRRCGASRGTSEYNTLWEALAILVALRIWGNRARAGTRILVRADSLAACGAIVRLASATPALNLIAAEIALDIAEDQYQVAVLTHIPGISNVLADALSRLEAPQAASVPAGLRALPRDPAPVRGRAFWATTVDP